MAEGRLLVTGGTGFIGSRLVAQALSRGWHVLVIIHPEDVGARILRFRKQVSLVTSTIADIESVGSQIADWQPNACIHLAWNTTPGVYLETRENIDWLNWSARLFEQLPNWGCKYILGVGTCAEYDSDFGYLRESTPVHPMTLYAACKSSLRMIGNQLSRQQSLEFAWARIFYLYGPDEHEKRLVPDCIRTLMRNEHFLATGGTQIRDYLHVDDVVSGLLTVVEAQYCGDVNICSSQPISIRAVIETIGREMDRAALIDFTLQQSGAWDPPVLIGSNIRLRELGWQPNISLDTGIEATVRWWQGRAPKS